MEFEKIRNLSDEELVLQEKQAAEQLFRLRFQTKLGQNEGVKKLRGLKLDIARIKTIQRQRQLGTAAPVATAPAVPAKKARKTTKKEAL
ncbi:MAG: 50S ribosomal protein L29 [Acidobacteriaceae bacterium]